MNARIMKTAARHAAGRAARFNLYAILVVVIFAGAFICKARADFAQPVAAQLPVIHETSR